jgi:glycerophosphoryl diester phosphodiesterase
MKVFAHRARLNPLELGNSIRNFVSALNTNITGIETDVCFSSDKRMMIYHPGSTDPDLQKLKWQTISGSIFNVPLLDVFLEMLKAYPEKICLLDIKNNSKELVERIIITLEMKNLAEQVYLTAFQSRMPFPPFNMETNYETLLHARKICPTIKTHMIVVWPFNLVGVAEKYRPDAISFGWLQEPLILKTISFELFRYTFTFFNLEKQIRKVKEMGIEVWGGICNNAVELEFFRNLGVTGIVSDNPVSLSRIAEQKSLR